MRETGRISKCGRTTRDPILKLGPLPRLSRNSVDVKDVVFPLRLVRTVQEEVVGVLEGEVWDRREQGPEDHGHGVKRWREGERGVPSVCVAEGAFYARVRETSHGRWGDQPITGRSSQLSSTNIPLPDQRKFG